MKKLLLKNTICLSLIFASNSFTAAAVTPAVTPAATPAAETKKEFLKRFFWSTGLRKGLTIGGSLTALALAAYLIVSKNNDSEEEVADEE